MREQELEPCDKATQARLFTVNREHAITTPQIQQKKQNKTRGNRLGLCFGVIGQNYNSLSCVFSISLAHSTAAWNFSVSRTELNHAHLSFVKRSQIVEM